MTSEIDNNNQHYSKIENGVKSGKWQQNNEKKDSSSIINTGIANINRKAMV